MIPGVDVFSGYGSIDWARVRAAGYRFAFIKCTEGNEPRRNDIRFAENVRNARDAGLYVSAYHFPYPLREDPTHPGRTPAEQAQLFWSVSGGLGRAPGELPPVVDAEWPAVEDWGKWGVTAATISGWLRDFCEHVTVLWGRRPIIYTYPFFWRILAASTDVSWAAEYLLWIANYTHSGEGIPPPSKQPIIPAPWTEWTFWQFSADGSPVRVPGIPACPIDRDVFAGDLDALRRLANIDPSSLTQPPPGVGIVDWDIVHAKFFTDDDEPDDAA